MKEYRNLIAIFLMAVMICVSGCNATKKYEETKAANTISAYEHFLAKHPKSKYAGGAELELGLLYEDKAWNDALDHNTVPGYQDFVTGYPSGRYSDQAEKNITQLIDQAWTEATTSNTIAGYNSFLSEYPDSKYAADAKKNIIDLEEAVAWKNTLEQGNIQAYKAFLDDYPEGNYAGEATENLFELEVILPLWEQTRVVNTTEGYKQFLEKYPSCTYSGQAKEKIREIEDGHWAGAVQNNTLADYQAFLASFPDGNHAKDAERKIVDLEVDAVFQGKYGSLPQMNRVSGGYGDEESNEIEIYNNTRYNLTVMYSGPDSKKVTFVPHETRTFSLANGNYRVAAWVDAAGVSNCGGNETLNGGSYNIEYYIYTSYY